jgi:hypothetical protein
MSTRNPARLPDTNLLTNNASCHATPQTHPQICCDIRMNARNGIMAPTDDAEKEERLKAALWYSVGQTIDSVSLSKDINATPHFIGAMSEMLWAQIGAQRRDSLSPPL